MMFPEVVPFTLIDKFHLFLIRHRGSKLKRPRKH